MAGIHGKLGQQTAIFHQREAGVGRRKIQRKYLHGSANSGAIGVCCFLQAAPRAQRNSSNASASAAKYCSFSAAVPTLTRT